MPNSLENEKLLNFEKMERVVRIGCEPGISEYSVLFEANGYASQELKTKTTEDVNHGEVILKKQSGVKLSRPKLKGPSLNDIGSDLDRF